MNATTVEGWARTLTGRKWHYVRDGRPLCGRGEWDGHEPLVGGVGSVGNECRRCAALLRQP